MKRLPERPDLDHLKRQAKDLLALYKSSDIAAIDRFRNALPGAASKDDGAIKNLHLRLHDAQSCVAREYGFASWADLKSFVDARAASAADRGAMPVRWLHLVYAGEIAGGENRARPQVAARLLTEIQGFPVSDPYLACATGDEALLRQTTNDDPAWVNRPGGPLKLPPLVAITHSSLLRLPAFHDRLYACAWFLLQAGANPNQAVGSRSAPASLNAPSEAHRLSALYGATGQNRDPELTKLLLDAGADPNDGESLYHSLESVACTRLLLQAGAVIAGTILYRALDLENVETLRLLLSHGADPNEAPTGSPTADWGSPMLWAIRRRRSRAHIAALLDAGADPLAKTPDGTNAYALAARFGLPEVAELLSQASGIEQVSEEEVFIAACTQGDETRARNIQSLRPDLPAALSKTQLQLLPELAALGCGEAVKLMVMLGWPIATVGGDWNASALNHAVFRGDAVLARFLLEHGASWKEQHGHGDNACGTLSWASCNEPVDGGDWLGCAEALVAHGMPTAEPDQEESESVVINGHRKRFSDDVTAFLLGMRSAQAASTQPDS